MQERRNSIANALELRLSCTNPWILCDLDDYKLMEMVILVYEWRLLWLIRTCLISYLWKSIPHFLTVD